MEEVQAATRMSPKEVQKHIDAYEYLTKEVVPEIANTSPETCAGDPGYQNSVTRLY